MSQEEHPQWPEEEVSLWADSKQQASPHVALTFGQPEPAALNILYPITCPLLLVAGDPEKGAVISPPDVYAMASVGDQGRGITIANAGHMVLCDQHDEFLATVKTSMLTFCPDGSCPDGCESCLR